MSDRLRALARSELGRRLALATVSSGAVWALGTAATFAVGVVLARALGPAGYGVYGTAVAVVTLLCVPAQLGLPLLATREVSGARVRGRPDEVAAIGWWFAALVAAASLLFGALLRAASGLLPLAPALRPALAAAALLLPGLSLSAVTTALLRGQERVVLSQLLDVLVRPLAFVGLLLAWSRPLAPAGAVGAQVGAAALIAVLGLALFGARLPLTGWRGSHRLRAWTAAALPMTLLELMRALEGSYGVLVAGAFASIPDAGLFRVALASSAVVLLPISLQTIVVAPFLAGAHAANERDRLARIVAAATLFMTAAVAALLLALAVAGRWVVPLAFGHAFAGAYVPLLLLGANQLLTAALGPNVILLSMTGHERAVARAYVASVLAAVAAALVLTPWFGVKGTAASALVATALRGMLLNAHAHRTLGIRLSLAAAWRTLAGRSSRAAATACPRGPGQVR